jgi:hypothetical protein
MDSYDPATIAAGLPRGTWKAAMSCGPNGGNCVEVNLGARGLAGLRDSKSPDGPVLVFGTEHWRAFLNSAGFGRFDRA